MAGQAQRDKGFTLVELLVVMAILATLFAMMAPAIQGVKSSVMQTGAVNCAAQLGQAITLYSGDHDDQYPLAMYEAENGNWRTWFGMQTGEAEFDYDQGIMVPYYKPGKLKDASHHAVPYLGDMSGFGYNYGYIGGDFHIINDYSDFPNCYGATTGSELSSPSTTVVFATSAFHKELWLEDGDGRTYDFGFIDPPELWDGNPNVDFRHFGDKKVYMEEEIVQMTGRAVFLFADGSAKSMTRTQIPNEYFRRNQAEQ